MKPKDIPDSVFPITRRRWLVGAAGGVTALAPGLGFAQAVTGDHLRRSQLYYGRDTPPRAWMPLRAGPLTMFFDRELAFLRYVRLGEWEVIRGVYSAVRDRNWGTVPPRVTNFEAVLREAAFDLTFDVVCRQGPIDFVWKGRLTGGEDGTIRFEMDGEARSAFLRNRIGFCVLHPIRECAGKPCVVEHVDGSCEEGRFPELISPHQPFFDIHAISHQVEPGVTAELRLEGDVFEMEDQRNWTDASYKTYCTPLARPFPVEVAKGTRIRQSVTLRLSGKPRRAGRKSRSPAVELRPSGAAPIRVPPIGLKYAEESPEPTKKQIERLRAMRLSHLRVDLRPGESRFGDVFARAAALSKELGIPLEAAVFVGEDAERALRAAAAAAGRFRARLERWLVYDAKKQWTRPGLAGAARGLLKGPVGAGANTNFTELNRNRPQEPVDLLCYAANPQVHAFDNASLVETFEGLRDTVRTARSFADGAKVAVTTITLRQQFNPVATGGPVERDRDSLPPSVDPRQMSLFGAGWTLGSLRALCESGADSVTYYETIGWRGVMELETGPPLPQRFPSIPGAVFPLYHVLADVLEFAGGEAVPVEISRPLHIAGMILQRGQKRSVLLANVTGDIQYARVQTPGWRGRWRRRMLDEYSAERAMRAPGEFRRGDWMPTAAPAGVLSVALLPYAYVRLDYEV